MGKRGPESRSPGADELRKLYEKNLLSYEDIARRYGVTRQSVMRWLRSAGIEARSTSESTRLGMRKWKPTESHKEKLRENAKKARAAVTPASRKKHAVAMKGRVPPNKGKPWSDETRAKHSYRQTTEYRAEMAERFRGEKSVLWRGGKTTAEDRRMQNWEWKKRRKECYERDRWTCQDCNVHCTQHGPTRIQAHHIIPRRIGGGDELDNLTTLCASCHHKRERRWDIRKD